MQSYHHRLVVQLSRLATHKFTSITTLLITSHKENKPSPRMWKNHRFNTKGKTHPLRDVKKISDQLIK
jgi:hypothetical protein